MEGKTGAEAKAKGERNESISIRSYFQGIRTWVLTTEPS